MVVPCRNASNILRASLYLIKEHPIFGIGTGDAPDLYQQAYDELDSPLDLSYRRRAHNQYLSITVAFGAVGLLLFLAVLLLPYCSNKNIVLICTPFSFASFCCRCCLKTQSRHKPE